MTDHIYALKGAFEHHTHYDPAVGDPVLYTTREGIQGHALVHRVGTPRSDWEGPCLDLVTFVSNRTIRVEEDVPPLPSRSGHGWQPSPMIETMMELTQRVAQLEAALEKFKGLEALDDHALEVIVRELRRRNMGG